MKNEYEIRGEVTAIFINSPKHGKFETLISTNNLDRVKEFLNSWCVKWNNNTKSFYVHGHMPTENGKRPMAHLHRWITNAPDGMDVDHFNHDTLDNTDSNLRVITQSENRQNLKGAMSNSKSGVRGVNWHNKDNKWHVRIQINKVRKYVGFFDNIEEAECAAIEARMHHMPFSLEALI